MRISDWSSDVCSSDLDARAARPRAIVDLAGRDDIELGQAAGVGFGGVELGPVGREADAVGIIAREDHFLDEAAVDLGVENPDDVVATRGIIALAMIGEPR